MCVCVCMFVIHRVCELVDLSLARTVPEHLFVEDRRTGGTKRGEKNNVHGREMETEGRGGKIMRTQCLLKSWIVTRQLHHVAQSRIN